MTEQIIDDQHSIGKSLLLHLLPGMLIGLCYFALLPSFNAMGYPSLMVLMTAIILILIPFEFGLLMIQGYRKNGRFSLDGIVYYRNKIPLWQYFVFVPVLFVIVGVIFTGLKPVDNFFQNSLFAWMPTLDTGLTGEYSKKALVITYAMVAVFGAIIGPVIEEMYFRGYLLPRMNYAGKWAPLLHSFLFALYHVFTPWMFITRTFGMLPLIFAVQRKNLVVSMMVHVLVNLIDVVIGVSFILGMA